jgi:deoxyribodipyrimidine photo-lyase
LDGLPDGEGPGASSPNSTGGSSPTTSSTTSRASHPALRPEFQRFPWRSDAALLRAWREGRTGYPAVDAGMRQLWESGWMHNRLRMITGSFLVKHLLQPWQDGARWFWDTLVDADLANNTLGWQWVAGCGPDAAPYFRIFNPVAQGQRFDPQGRCIRRHVPELALLPDDAIHEPWKMADLVPAYPPPLVDHPIARARALESYKMVKIQP